MIIHVPVPVGETATSNEFTVRAFQIVSIAHREGKHLLCVSEEAYRKAEELKLLDDVSKPIFRQAAAEYTKTGSARKRVAAFISLCWEDLPSSRVRGGQIEIRVPVVSMSDSALAQPSVLLGENLDDSEFIKQIAASVCEMSINLRPMNGGGSTTSQVLQRLVSEETLALAVVDSDRSCRRSKLGGTGKSVQAVKLTPLQRVHLLDCHEMENIVPLETWLNVLPRHPEGSETWKHVVGDQETWRFFDLKNGWSGHDLAEHVNGCGVECEWNRAIPCAKWDQKCREKDGVAPLCGDTKSCVCTGIRGLGENCLQVFRKRLEELSLRERRAVMKQIFEQAHVRDLVELAIAFGYCDVRRSA